MRKKNNNVVEVLLVNSEVQYMGKKYKYRSGIICREYTKTANRDYLFGTYGVSSNS